MSNPDTRPLALVLGATGGLGGAVADRLLAGGWRVRAMNRDPEAARRKTGRDGLEWVAGDSLVADDVLAAAAGAQVIVHGVNPPGYRNWGTLVMPMLENTIAAARAVGARIVFPANIYNYGPDAFPRLSETSPQNPMRPKGELRVKMETTLRAAADDGVPVLILRMGDFFGPEAGSNWLVQGIISQGKPLASASYPGPLDLPHAWAYLPDAAETIARLLDTDLGLFETFHLQGQEVTGRQLIAALETAAGRKLKVGKLPWAMLQVIAPFNETFRGLVEMRYLWEREIVLDNSRLVARLGAEPRTPLVQALREALKGANALPKVMA